MPVVMAHRPRVLGEIVDASASLPRFIVAFVEERLAHYPNDD